MDWETAHELLAKDVSSRLKEPNTVVMGSDLIHLPRVAPYTYVVMDQPWTLVLNAFVVPLRSPQI
jgi:hypothetical protein